MSFAFPYPPGRAPGRVPYPPDKYNPHQEHIWQAKNRLTYAFTHDRLDTMMPTPGVAVDMADFEAWRERALAAWIKEGDGSRGRIQGKQVTRGLRLDDLPEAAWLWFYQRIKSAPPAPTPVTSTYHG
jgi:hypothetical protein